MKRKKTFHQIQLKVYVVIEDELTNFMKRKKPLKYSKTF